MDTNATRTVTYDLTIGSVLVGFGVLADDTSTVVKINTEWHCGVAWTAAPVVNDRTGVTSTVMLRADSVVMVAA